jgi:hypothetical protein
MDRDSVSRVEVDSTPEMPTAGNEDVSTPSLAAGIPYVDPRLGRWANTIEIIAILCWWLRPQATVEDQQANRDQAPDQAVEPNYPARVGTGLPKGAGLNGAIGRVRDQCEQRAA